MSLSRRWKLAGVSAVVTAVVLFLAVRTGPGVMHGRDMEKFCLGAPHGLDRKGLTQMAEREGYIVTPGQDAQGDFLHIDDDRSGGKYRCQARFKPDGRIDSMNFSAGPQPKLK